MLESTELLSVLSQNHSPNIRICFWIVLSLLYWFVCVEKVTGGSLEESKEALAIAETDGLLL